MGATQSDVPEETMQRFERRTFFTRSEILGLLRRFRSLGGGVDTSVGDEVVADLPELTVNPFKERILRVFCSHRVPKSDDGDDDEDGRGLMSFEDFLHMFNAFSVRSSLEVKAYWAFKIYDYDEDNFISRSDIIQMLKTLTGEKLTPELQRKIAARVLDEGDLDGNSKLSRTEFMRLVYRIPDFAVKFQFAAHT